MGTSEELAKSILVETDWTVGACDTAVQTLEEALVRLQTCKEITQANATRIIDPVNGGGTTFDT
jgi:hypothetical protein